MNPVEEYIAAQAEDMRPLLRQVRDCIREAVPDAEETIAWGMPTYRGEKNIIHFAAAKRHIGIYPGPQAVEAFRDRLAGYQTSKGAIQLPVDRDLPLDLVAEIARWSAGYISAGTRKVKGR